MILSRPGFSVTSQRPSGIRARPQGCDRPEATTLWRIACSVFTPGARVWPGKAGCWSGLLAGRVSSGAPDWPDAEAVSPFAPQAAARAKAKDKNDPFKLMGFGHRVYKNFDPRAKVMKQTCDEVLGELGINDPQLDLAMKLEEIALNHPYFAERNLYPNVDFYSGIVQRARDILLRPRESWPVIAAEPATAQSIYIPYVLVLAAIGPLASLIGGQLVGVSVLGTRGTVKREYTKRLIEDFSQGCEVTLVGSGELASLAESALSGNEVSDGEIAAELAPCFVDDGHARTDTVVLACTHYPLLLDRLTKLAPWPVDWIDPAPAIARRVSELLGAPGSARDAAGAEMIFTSKRPHALTAALTPFFGGRVPA